MEEPMEQRLLHTPEGVRDIYSGEYARKKALLQKLHRVVEGYGYCDIETPTFEYFDVFSREIGTTPSKDLYKFFDREGNTLVLRPDMTPAIARAYAKYFSNEELGVRLSYMGNTFVNNSSLQGHLKEMTQLGAELIGDGSVEADAEITAMIVEMLLAAGLTEFQVSIGHVEFFQSLLAEAGVDKATEQELRRLITNKNNFGVETLLEERNMNFVRIENGEVFIYGMHISPYEKGNIFNKDPMRVKKLLMHRYEINKIEGKIAEKGYTLVPLKVYFKGSLVKVSIGLAKGKKLYDKRQDIAKKDMRREAEREFKVRNL